MKQMKLLSHQWQIYGAFLFVASVLIALFSDVSHVARITHLSGDIVYDISSSLQFMLEHFLIPLSGILMALSMERREDEMISTIRQKSLLLAVIIWIIIGLLRIPASVLVKFKPYLIFHFYEVGFFPLLYIICLKLSLWIQNRKLSRSGTESSSSMTVAKPFLLPHKWQKIGLAIAVAVFVFNLFTMLFHLQAKSVLSLISALVIPVSLTVVAFSKEKADDERIDVFRWNALFKTVILFFILSFLIAVFEFILPHFCDLKTTVNIIRIVAVLTGWTAFMVYYLLIFKISLHKENKSLDNEE